MTTQQKLFNLYIEKNYPRLAAEHPKKDSLHSAYLTVWSIHRPIVPTADNFEKLVTNAYYRHILDELYYTMRYLPAEPVFWAQQEDIPDEEYEDMPTVADIMEREENRLKTFLKERFNSEEVIIFNLAIAQHTIEDIAAITGRKRADVRSVLTKIRKAIENDFQPQTQTT